MDAPREWKSRGGRGFGPAPFLIAGIVNVTPDSFSDGGGLETTDDAIIRCRALVRDGANIIDIGGESTRPGAAPICASEELERLMPVVAGAVAMRNAMVEKCLHVAVDTWRAGTAAAVLEAGVDIINDISGATFDPEMTSVLGQYRPGYVLMHTPARPERMGDSACYDSVVDTVCAFFEKALAVLTGHGLPEDHIILDPGIGFGKTAEHNLELLRGVERLHAIGRPLYIGLSRKSMFGDLFGLGLKDRDAITQVATALLAERGVYAHRVHDVAGAAAALKFAGMLL